MDYNDFLLQSKRDLVSCKLLFQNGDYGNAAYHLQQSVEKYVKSVLYRPGGISVPKTHIPLDYIDEILPGFKKIEDIARQYPITVETHTQRSDLQERYLAQCEGVFSELTNKSQREQAKISLWKNSLGIPFEQAEQAFFTRYPMFTQSFRLSLNRVFATSTSDQVGDAFLTAVNSDPDLKNLPYFREVAELARLVSATFPHEDLGRYPTDISTQSGTISSVQLYSNHKDKLGELIDLASQTMYPKG